MNKRPTVAIIGAGAVGATTAYALTLRNLATEIMLIDINADKEAGEVMDIHDTLSFVETGSVRGGDFSDAKQADIIIVTAGVSQRAGKSDSRLALLEKNAQIVRSIFKSIGKLRKDAIVIMVSNPVDILTEVAQKVSGLPPAQVFGSGTTLDSARLRAKLASVLGVSAQSTNGYVIGEHGNSQLVAWSTVTVGGIPAYKLPRWSKSKAKRIAEIVKKEAYEIIDRKGATFYGIAATVTDLVEAVLFDQKKILPVSSMLKRWNGVSGICMGAPAVVGRGGVEKHWPVVLSSEEKKAFQASAKVLKAHKKGIV